jgi:hypothetical protein
MDRAAWDRTDCQERTPGQDCQERRLDRAARTGLPGQGCQGRTAGIRQSGQERKERITRKRHPEQNM